MALMSCSPATLHFRIAVTVHFFRKKRTVAVIAQSPDNPPLTRQCQVITVIVQTISVMLQSLWIEIRVYAIHFHGNHLSIKVTKVA